MSSFSNVRRYTRFVGRSWIRGVGVLLLAVLAGTPLNSVACARLCASTLGAQAAVAGAQAGCHEDETAGQSDTLGPVVHDSCASHASPSPEAAALSAVRADSLQVDPLLDDPAGQAPLAYASHAPLPGSNSPPRLSPSASGRLTLRI